MCFTGLKLASLVAVVAGVVLYAHATSRRMIDQGLGHVAEIEHARPKYAKVAGTDVDG